LQLWNCRNANPAQTRLGDKYRQKIPPFCLEIIFGYFVNWHKSFWYLLGQQHPTPNSNIPKVFPKFSSIFSSQVKKRRSMEMIWVEGDINGKPKSQKPKQIKIKHKITHNEPTKSSK
jgi:hypothetical protein